MRTLSATGHGDATRLRRPPPTPRSAINCRSGRWSSSGMPTSWTEVRSIAENPPTLPSPLHRLSRRPRDPYYQSPALDRYRGAGLPLHGSCEPVEIGPGVAGSQISADGDGCRQVSSKRLANASPCERLGAVALSAGIALSRRNNAYS
jgi:hypothetical protein